MSFNVKYHFRIILVFIMIILSACQLQDPNKTHGIIFLENRSKKLTLNVTNKNDVTKIIGEPQIIDDDDKNTWIYIERTLTKGKFHKLGKHILKENNILILNFDKYGILKTKDFLNKEDIKEINFSAKKTENNLTKKSFVQSFLESIRQKMYGNRK